MPIAPTTDYTPTYTVWITASGTDVGTQVVYALTGIETLLIILVIVLGLWTAIRVMP